DCIDDGIEIIWLCAAVAPQNTRYPCALEKRDRLLAAHRRRREGDVLFKLETETSAARHDDQAHLGIAVKAKREFQAAAKVLGDQHAFERHGEAMPLHVLHDTVVGIAGGISVL